MANLNVTDYNGQRKHAFNSSTAGYAIPGAYPQHSGSQASALRAAPYLSAGNPMMQAGHGDAGMAAIAHGFGAMNLNPSNYAATSRASSQIPATSPEYAIAGWNQPHGVYMPSQQQILYTLPGSSANSSTGLYTGVPQHMQPMHSSGYGHSVDNSPHGQSWTPRIPSDGSAPGMPTLITPRRGSISSNEEHVPATPYTGAYNNGVTVLDRSPNTLYTHSGTPSPLHYMQQYVTPLHKYPAAATTPMHIQMLVVQDPPIPRAIPAPSSPMKPLDRCLENKSGETNVYIRGLLPETTDDMLHVWGMRFGDIQSSKSIIDLKSGLCKG